VTRKHVLILDGNPDPGADRLTHALARAYHEGAEEAGHIVRHINIGGVAFPLLRSARDFETEPTEKAIIEAQGAFLSADHIVIVYPLWLGGPPALLKAYMEQLARDNFLLGKSDGGFPKGRLKGRSARVIVTMGMPALIYRLMYGAHGVKAFNRSILNLAGIKPVTTTLFGGRQIQPPQSAKTIQTIRDVGRRLV
jgi:putative NADPH-quinone reductase